MRRLLSIALVTAALALGGTLSAQLNFAEIPYDAVEPLTFPPNIHLGEAAGVATNSKGDVFVYTRTGTPVITTAGSRNVSHGGWRLFQFDRTGKFVREIGQGVYGFLQAQQVRVDPQDNIWVVDQLSTQVIKFDPNGRIQMIFSRKPEAMRVPNLPLAVPADTYTLVGPRPPQPPAAPPAAAPAGAEAVRPRARAPPGKTSTARPTSRGTRQGTSTWPTDMATRVLRSTTLTVSGSRTGARLAPIPGSSEWSTGFRLIPRTTCTRGS